MGTTCLASISGWRAWRTVIWSPSTRTGQTALCLWLQVTLAKHSSSSESVFTFWISVSFSLPTSSPSADKTRSISCCSLPSRSFSSLLASKTLYGSMNSVAPLALLSCSKPLICPAYSLFTGTTYRPLRWVMMPSCSILRVVGLERIACKRALILSSAPRIFRRSSRSCGEASS